MSMWKMRKNTESFFNTDKRFFCERCVETMREIVIPNKDYDFVTTDKIQSLKRFCYLW